MALRNVETPSEFPFRGLAFWDRAGESVYAGTGSARPQELG